jgi:hypothetical protein
MKSENARFLRQGLIEQCRKMTPAQRVLAFIEHSRLMQEVRNAGRNRRNSPAVTKRKRDQA